MNEGPSPLALLLAFPRLLILVSGREGLGGFIQLEGNLFLYLAFLLGLPLPLFFFLLLLFPPDEFKFEVNRNIFFKGAFESWYMKWAYLAMI